MTQTIYSKETVINKNHKYLRLNASKYLLLFLFVLLSSTLSLAQETSEITLSLNTNRSGIEDLFKQKEYNKVVSYVDSVEKISSYKKELPFLYLKKADAFYYLNDIKQALSFYLKALHTTEMGLSSNNQIRLQALSYTGFCYAELGLENDALSYYKKSLQLAYQLNDSSEIASQEYGVASSYMKLGNYSAAIKSLQNAYVIDLGNKDTLALAYDLNAMGYTQLDIGNPVKAIDYFKESVEFLKHKKEGTTTLGVRYNNISKAFLMLNEKDSAIRYVRLSIEQHEAVGDSVNLAERWITIANINSHFGQYSAAKKWGEKSIDYFKKNRKGSQLINANQVLVEYYRSKELFNKAVDLTEENITLSKELSSVKLHYKSLNEQSMNYEVAGNYKKAIQFQNSASLLNDSIKSEKSNQYLRALEVKYEVDKILHENEILNLQNNISAAEISRKNRIIFWITTVVIMLLLMILLLISRIKIKNRLHNTEVGELRVKVKALLEFKPEEAGIVKESVNQALTNPLSDREFEILNFAISDMTNSEIAEKVFLSVNTVKFHLKNIYSKLGVSNRKEALNFAIQFTSQI